MSAPLSQSEQLRAAADGRPGAAERNFGGRTRYVPTLDRKPIPFSNFDDEDSCFDLSKDAKQRAKQFKEYCRSQIAQANGEAP